VTNHVRDPAGGLGLGVKALTNGCGTDSNVERMTG
jgi:hypothetical protein